MVLISIRNTVGKMDLVRLGAVRSREAMTLSQDAMACVYTDLIHSEQ